MWRNKRERESLIKKQLTILLSYVNQFDYISIRFLFPLFQIKSNSFAEISSSQSNRYILSASSFVQASFLIRHPLVFDLIRFDNHLHINYLDNCVTNWMVMVMVWMKATIISIMIGNRDFDDVNKSRGKLMAIKIEIKRFLWPFVILSLIFGFH